MKDYFSDSASALELYREKQCIRKSRSYRIAYFTLGPRTRLRILFKGWSEYARHGLCFSYLMGDPGVSM